ncbi:hypothetical protein ACIPPQ_14720 [Sphingopyxis sp. LARHCG72]
MSEGEFPFGDDPFDAFADCACCGLDFLLDEMTGELCPDCADEQFGDAND